MQKTIKPAARGSLLCQCRGKVLSMLSNYGWIMVYGDIDHPSVEKHGGDVYVRKDDVADGKSLCKGDTVTFYLYVDDKGLGAEECQVEQRAASHFDPNAAVLAPMNAKPTSESEETEETVNVLAWAETFSRMPRIFEKYLDDEDDDEYVVGKPWKTECEPSLDGSTTTGETSDSEEWTKTFSRLSRVFVYDSDDEDDEEYIVGKPWKAGCEPSLDGSATMGETSDSEEWTKTFSRLSRVFVYESDDEDDEEYVVGKPWKAEVEPSLNGSPSKGETSDLEGWAKAFSRLSQVFAYDSDDEDDEDYIVGKPWKAEIEPSLDGSTSAGETTDSEDESSSEMLPKGLPAGFTLPSN